MTTPTGRETAPATARLDLRLLAPILLGFWCLYFAIVTLSNVTDLLRSLRLLPADLGLDLREPGLHRGQHRQDRRAGQG